MAAVARTSPRAQPVFLFQGINRKAQCPLLAITEQPLEHCTGRLLTQSDHAKECPCANYAQRLALIVPPNPGLSEWVDELRNQLTLLCAISTTSVVRYVCLGKRLTIF